MCVSLTSTRITGLKHSRPLLLKTKFEKGGAPEALDDVRHHGRSFRHSSWLLCSRLCKSVWWCGVVWCGVVWCGVVWCGVVCISAPSDHPSGLRVVTPTISALPLSQIGSSECCWARAQARAHWTYPLATSWLREHVIVVFLASSALRAACLSCMYRDRNICACMCVMCFDPLLCRLPA
jgi:hypothetical protein